MGHPKVVEGSSEDLDGDGAPDLAMKEEGGRHTPFQNRVQDYNSSRSNKSSSAQDTGAGADSGAGDADARRRVEVLKSNKQGDPNANRYDSGGGSPISSIDNAPEEKERGVTINTSHVEYQTEKVSGLKGHRDVGGYRAPDGTSGSGGGAPVQDHNSSRSNKSSSALDDGGAGSGGSGGGQGEDLARKGWDGTVKGSTKADEAPEGTNASNPIPGVGIVVKHNPKPGTK